MKKTLLAAALVGVLSAGASTAAKAQDEDETKEKCAGVAKAGKNSCASLDGSHSCAGKATKDNDPNEWTYVPAGKCEEMGGKLVIKEIKH